MEHLAREEERLARLRREMREQDKRRFQDPDYRTMANTIYALVVWRKKKWKFVSHTHGRITPKRISQLRKKFRRQIGADEILRVVDLRAYERDGAGAAPLAPPSSKRLARPAKVNKEVEHEQQQGAVMRMSIPVSKRWGKCWKCSVRSKWFVAFTVKNKNIVRKCCTKHAWREQHLPRGECRNVVVVQRRVAQ